MQREKAYRLKIAHRRRQRRSERGVALITTLLLLMLLTGLTLAMAWSTRSDVLINGYYRDFRGSFYAADSGLTIARQDMQNQILAAVKPGWSATSPPLSITGADAPLVQTYLTTTYGSFKPLTGTGQGQAASSWPAQYEIQNANFTFVSCTIQDGSLCTAPASPVTSYIYTYSYDFTAVGRSKGTEGATVTDRGNVTLTAALVPPSSTKSFAAWGMFIDQDTVCNGSTLVPGTITGPVFTNGGWTFGTSGSYTFTDPVGSNSSTAGFQFNNKCDSIAATSDKQGNTTIAPTFKSGFNLGQPKVSLPQNSYNQERAVLDGKGASNQNVTNSDLSKALMNINGVAYPTSGASTGVFLPYTTVDSNGNKIPPKFTGGGIFVQGDANVVLSPSSNGTAQVYTITQGSTVTTITIDPKANTTTMTSGATTLTVTGVPQQLDPATGADLGYDTMLYVNGNITSLSGPGQGMPAIQDATALTVTAASNITITGDVLYKTEPVTLTASGNTPIDTLIPANNTGQALGIFTANGNINLKNSQSSGNLEVDASLAMISQNGTGGLVNTGSAINTLTIVGGRIQNTIQNINTTTRNVLFDRRYASGFSPPWFPSTTVTSGTATAGQVTPTIWRAQWLNKTPFF